MKQNCDTFYNICYWLKYMQKWLFSEFHRQFAELFLKTIGKVT
jgi:hypothetical protein